MVDSDQTINSNGDPQNGRRQPDWSALRLRSATIAAVASGHEGGTSLGIAGVGTPRPVVDEVRRSLLRAILANDAIHAVYQPIVSLQERKIVGYEALARGPRRSTLERPDALLAVAQAAGRLEELDWICRGAALKGALAARLDPALLLLIKVHPQALGAPIPEHLVEPMERATSELRVVLELPEAALSGRPAELLRVLAAVRDRGLGVALDNVGADPRQLTWLPFVRPDVVKLNLRMLEQRPEPDVVAILAAVNQQCERTGAVALVEGIETEDHLGAARAMGASLGEGYLFGRPDRLPVRLARPRAPVRLDRRPFPSGETPFEVVTRARESYAGDLDLVSSLARMVEGQAISLARGGVVLGAVPRPDLFASGAQRRWAALAEDSLFAALFGAGLPSQPAPGVRGVSLDSEDPLAGEWSVVVAAPHFAAAMVAREQSRPGADGRPRFDIALTHDRDLVGAAGIALLRRVAIEEAAL